MEHLISVIIPTYNRAKFIKESIDSVVGQKLPSGYDIEILVIDDGSTDNTEDVLKPFVVAKKIKYYNIPHSGLPSIVRNFGIQRSKGNLVAFQDSDDIWAINKLTYQLPAFDDSNVALSYGNAEMIDSKGKKIGNKILADNVGKSGNIFEYLVNENIISTLTVIARRDVLDAVGCFNESSELYAVEDYHLWLRICQNNPVKYVDKTLAFYRVHDNNISSGGHLVAVKRLQKLFRLLLKDLPSERKIINTRLKKLYSDAANLSKGLHKNLYTIKSYQYHRMSK
jgi:glycosyltransferase involved in cell wall biosynthesis